MKLLIPSVGAGFSRDALLRIVTKSIGHECLSYEEPMRDADLMSMAAKDFREGFVGAGFSRDAPFRSMPKSIGHECLSCNKPMLLPFSCNSPAWIP